MNQTHKVLPDDTLRMFPQQGTSFPRHLMIAFRTLAGPTSQILQLASLTRCHRQVGQWILQSPVNPCLSLPNREIWHCIAAPKSSIAVSSQILFICPTVHCLPPAPPPRLQSSQTVKWPESDSLWSCTENSANLTKILSNAAHYVDYWPIPGVFLVFKSAD